MTYTETDGENMGSFTKGLLTGAGGAFAALGLCAAGTRLVRGRRGSAAGRREMAKRRETAKAVWNAEEAKAAKAREAEEAEAWRRIQSYDVKTAYGMEETEPR